MKSPDDDVCLQGIEFWSNVCEEEMDLAVELTEVGFYVMLAFIFIIHKPNVYEFM